MRMGWLLIVVASLAGCAPSIKGETPNSIVLGGVSNFNDSSAFELAQAHCQKYGKNARPVEDRLHDGYVTCECID
jgi:hypothetical protein